MIEATNMTLEFIVSSDNLDFNFIRKIFNSGKLNIWVKGKSQTGCMDLKREDTEFCYEIGPTNHYDVDILTKEFVKVIAPYEDELVAYIANHKLKPFVCIVTKVWSNETPALIFERGFLKLINRLNCEIGISLYMFDIKKQV